MLSQVKFIGSYLNLGKITFALLSTLPVPVAANLAAHCSPIRSGRVFDLRQRIRIPARTRPRAIPRRVLVRRKGIAPLNAR